MKILKSLFLGIYLFMQALASYAVPGERIVRNADGDYIITYWNGSSLMETKFVPATKIDPNVFSSFRFGVENSLVYRYKLSNGLHAQQPIVNLRLPNITGVISQQPIADIPANIGSVTVAASFLKARQSVLLIPKKWGGDISPVVPSGVFVMWDYKYKYIDRDDLQEGLLPGESQGGFGFSSYDLPGIGITEAEGMALPVEYEDEGPSADSEIVDQLDKLETANFVSRNAAVPTIAVPSPFDAAVLLDRIRTHLATWPSKQLLDLAFAAQLDRAMVAAADAFRLNQPKAGKEHIKSLRKMLDREHKYLDHDDEDNDDSPEHKAATRLTIDRLAARVLDFDLRYVLKRIEHGHEQEHKEGDRK